MALEDYKVVVGTVATIVTIIQFLSGIDICKQIRNQGTTGDISGLPLAMGAGNAWFVKMIHVIRNYFDHVPDSKIMDISHVLSDIRLNILYVF